MKSYFRLRTSVVLTFVTILFLSACSKEPMQPDDTLALESKPAKLVVIGQNSNNTFLNYPATVKAENVSALSFEVSGVVDILSVVESQKVQKGDVLAKLDVRDLQASLQSAQAQFDSANSEFERAGRLIKQDAISKSVFEQRRSQRDVNQAQLDTAHKALGDAILVAPFAGFIAEVSIKEKQAIQAGTTAITILGDGDMEATINLPASIIAVADRTGKSVGKAYLVFSFAPDIQVATALKEVNLSADSASQTYKVTFTFTAPNEMNILPGMNATLWFPDPRNSEAEEQLAIPIASVAIDGNQKFVWLVDQSNSTVSRRDITVQDGVGEMLVITSGLQMGDTVVAAGISSISAGMKVHPWSKSLLRKGERMNLAEFSIKNQLLCVIAIILALVGGWNAYQTMPRFEDPEFTIRTAIIYTQYPGASPEQVALEVTDPLETAIQQMQEVDTISTVSSAGVSEIRVNIKYQFSESKEDLQIIWTKLRNKMNDAQASLPSEARTPIVNDDFGDVYGLSYLVTGDDFSYAELRSYAKELQKDILQVKGVGKVQMTGSQDEAIFIEISSETSASLGVSIEKLYDILKQQNSVVFAGNVNIGNQRLSIDPSGDIDSVESIKNLLVSNSADGKILYLKDIANVYRDYKTPASKIIRYDGKKAIALGVSNVAGGNVVVVGKAVDQKLSETQTRRPLGIEVHEYYHQGKVVEASVNDFVMNVIAALAIVIATLLFTMGIRSALVISFILLVTVGATLTTMQIIGVPLHRISLGALIISLGMMVDNAVVITEAILVGVKKGRKKLDIAKEIVFQTKWPLLAGTLVGVIAFAPIGFAPGDTAEFTGDLFWVVMIALLFSWVLALTITPLTCYWLFPETVEGDTETGQQEEDKEGAFFIQYKKLMRWALHSRWLVIGFVLGLFALSIWGAQFMTQGFFPRSTSPQMVVDIWMPEGTRIEHTEQYMIEIEDFVSQMDGVNAVQTLIGGGTIRYMLTYGSESANSSYGQLLVRVDNYKKIDGMMPIVQDFIAEHYPEAQAKAWRFVLGPGGGSAIEAEFSGPDPIVLRRLANEAKMIMNADGSALSVKDDWREPVSIIQPVYSASKARQAGVSREDLSKAIASFYNGKQVGTFKEGTDLIPIVSRLPGSDVASIDDIRSIQVTSSITGKTVPILQVTEGFKTVWRNGKLRSEDRVFRIKAQSDPLPGELAATLVSRIKPQIEAIDLPAGYAFEWGGESGSSADSSSDLMSTIPLGFLAMVLVVVALFGKIKQPLVIWSVVPLASIGVVFGLVVTGVPLEFMGMLGLLSLSGLLIQNGIILVDRMDTEIDEGKPRFDAIVDSAASRVRPVVLGSFTTALGVIPLFFDAFFQSMAVVIVFGLSFATVITLLFVPVLYATFMQVHAKETAL